MIPVLLAIRIARTIEVGRFYLIAWAVIGPNGSPVEVMTPALSLS